MTSTNGNFLRGYNGGPIARVRRDGKCYIAGEVERQRDRYLSVAKTVDGYVGRDVIAAHKVHLAPCPHCPCEAEILEREFAPGRDPLLKDPVAVLLSGSIRDALRLGLED